MSNRVSRAGASVRRGAGALLTPTGLRGAAVEVAWVAAHAALYPLGVLAERARIDHPARPGRALAGPARSADRRRRGGGHADPAGARHGRQPLDLHAAATWSAPARLRSRADAELQPADQRRPHRGRGTRRASRAAVRRDRLRAHPRHRSQHGRDDRALLRAAPRRRRARAHAGHPRQPAHRHARCTPGAAPAGPPAAPGQRRRGRADGRRRPAAGPASSRCGATSTR